MRPNARWIRRSFVAGLATVCVLAIVGGALAATSSKSGREATPAAAERPHSSVPEGFQPAVLAAENGLGRYFVTLKGASVATAMKADPALSGSAQEATANAADASQQSAIAETKASGGKVLFRYDTLLNGYSAQMSPRAAAELANRSDVASVHPSTSSTARATRRTARPSSARRRSARSSAPRAKASSSPTSTPASTTCTRTSVVRAPLPPTRRTTPTSSSRAASRRRR